MERSTADTKKKVLSSHFVESSRPSLTTVRLEVHNQSVKKSPSTLGKEEEVDGEGRVKTLSPPTNERAEIIHTAIPMDMSNWATSGFSRSCCRSSSANHWVVIGFRSY